MKCNKKPLTVFRTIEVALQSYCFETSNNIFFMMLSLSLNSLSYSFSFFAIISINHLYNDSIILLKKCDMPTTLILNLTIK